MKNKSKQSQIDSSSKKMIIYASVATFLFFFTLVSGRTLLSKMNYQNRVINAKNTALNNSMKDVAINDSLISAYNSFIRTPTNLLGGSSTGSGSIDGNNAKLILDSMPSEYDFPALATSLQKLLNSTGVNIGNLSGSDSSVGVTTSLPGQNSLSSTGAVSMPFSFSVTGTLDSVNKTLAIFESSIRPFQFSKISISGGNNNLTLDAKAETYYLPAEAFSVTKSGVL